MPHTAESAAARREMASPLRDSGAVIASLAGRLDDFVAIADRLVACLEPGGTIYLCGNGGSAADAQHVAAEFVGLFLRERRPLPAIALNSNTSILRRSATTTTFRRSSPGGCDPRHAA